MRKPPSWLIVCLLLYLFFPVGIWLLVRKVNGEKHRSLENSKFLKILAAVLFVIAACSISSVFPAKGSVDLTILVAVLLLAGGGVLCLIKSRKLKRYGEYMAVCKIRFEREGSLELEPAAAELGITYERLVMDLEQMIENGDIDNAFIDYTARCLAAKERKSPYYVVNCPHCGGISEIPKGENAVCSYCGSAL